MRKYGSYALANPGNPRYSNSLYQSLQTNLGAKKVDLDYGVDFLNLIFSNIPTAVSAAKKAGLAIIVLGTLSVGSTDPLVTKCTDGESFTHADLGFPGAQQQHLDAVLDASTLAILILSGGQPFVLNDSILRSNKTPRFLLCGEFTGDALADILTGEVNHSGKLPISLPQDSSATPVFYDYHGRDDTGTADSLLGFHSTYQFPLLLRDTPMPFGFGLGYTTFSVSIPIVEAENEVIGARLNITNTGSIPGEEVVQIYHRPHTTTGVECTEGAYSFGQEQALHLTTSIARTARNCLSFVDVRRGVLDHGGIRFCGSTIHNIGTTAPSKTLNMQMAIRPTRLVKLHMPSWLQ